MAWTTRRAPALLCIPLLAAVSACSGTAAAQPKPNGCTAVTSGTSQGRAVVTYDDVTGDPSMSSAVSAAVAAWNAAAVPILLKPVRSGATITIVASTGPIETTRCTATDHRRTSVVALSSKRWHGTGGAATVANPERDVALELGHALGLKGAGGCTALMTKKTDCPSYVSGPDAAEVAEVRTLYRAVAAG